VLTNYYISDLFRISLLIACVCVCVSTLSYANIDRERAANKKKETDDIFFALIFWLVVVPTFHPLVVSQSSCVHHFNLTSRVASFWSRTMMIKFNMQIELVISKTANSDKDKISFFSLLKKTIGQNTIRRNCTTKKNENEEEEEEEMNESK